MNQLLLAMLLAWTAPPTPTTPQPDRSVLEAESHRIAVMQHVKNCVLAIFPANGQGGGSGVVIAPDGYALSNFHVVMPCGKSMQCGMADGRVYDAVIVGIDPTGDVALIKLFGRNNFPHATLGDSDRTRVGDWVFAMGNPFLLATDLQPTITFGLVSGVHRYQAPADTLLEYTDCLQIDASINPGNSGGPLFDAEGRLIGINGRASFEKRGRVNVGAAYAISINQIKNFLGDLHGGRIVDHATLGARVGADAEGRVVVTDILESSDAFRRGLRYDDEILSFAGRTITTPNGFKNILGIFPNGWRLPLSYRHDGKRRDVLIRLAALHNEQELLEKTTGRRSEEITPPPPPEKNHPAKKKNPEKIQPTSQQRELPIPEVVRQHFTERRGFANYYFNAFHQRRVWNAWKASTHPPDAKESWTLLGQTERGDAARFHLSDTAASLQLPNRQITWHVGPWANALRPENGNGLLPALYFWRRLAAEGLETFGNVEYVGTAPLPGCDGRVDVLLASHHGADCRFYFEPATGRLLTMEMFPEENADPCEIHFSDYRDFNGRWWPCRIEVSYAGERFAVFQLKEARLER